MSSDTRKAFPFPDFEPRWQARWEAEKTYRTPNPGDPDFDASKPKFYALDMFPYPSGDGLHVGHPEGYTATDIISRARRKQGYNVLHPMGWDAFGLPAEQYAIKTGQHPRVTTERNVARFTGQLKRLGFAYDWDREVNTTDPGYFKWTQWIFLQIYNAWCNPATGRAEPISTYPGPDPDSVRLAYVAEVPVNWCPELGTVLANEEVVDGKSEVGGFPVERRPMRQWMLRITSFADRLADELESLDWPAGIKTRQRDWIGRSEGAEVRFQVPACRNEDGIPAEIVVFTTRPDTLCGATYMVLAPEHPLVSQITRPAQWAAVEAYQKATASKSDLDRGVAKTKFGVDTGATAVNPVNGEAIPIWIADYVMMGYGTGAIMAVPAHDDRDFEFATQFKLPIRQVVAPAKEGGAGVSPASEKSDTVPFSYNPFFETGVGVHTTKRRLPHWDQGDKCYFVTWRLKDSVPDAVLSQWHDEKREWLADHPEPWNPETEEEFHTLFSDRMEAWLDAGTGSRLLARQEIASIVASALHHFDGQRYDLDAFVVMPTHVHVALHLRPGEILSKVLHSWKSFSAKEINRVTESTGAVWQEESFDRIIRNENHWRAVMAYIAENPVNAKLRDEEFNHFRSGGDLKGTVLISLAGETPAPPSGPCFTGEGVAVNSAFLDGLPTTVAKQQITTWLEEQGLGKKTVNYKLRDWLFARQRYWGEPFPLVWENGRHRALPESELPLLPPTLEDFKPTGTPEPPLSKATEWVRYSDTVTRELNTMPQWAGSCWYYLRYCDARNTTRFVSAEAERYWMGGGEGPSADATARPPASKGGVDLYVGGTEHAVLHLLYARFWHKVLFDLGHVSTAEPFHKLVNQGLILGEDGQKMSKSRGNVVNPDSVVEEFGADSLRLFEMFMGPLEATKPWSTKGVEGVHRFLARVWRLVMAENQEGVWVVSPKLSADAVLPGKARKVLHETIKKVTEDIEALSFNTAIAQMMICTNELTGLETRPVSAVVTLLHLLNPFAPHLTEELYATLASGFPALPQGHVALDSWPVWEAAALIESEVELVVQVNGKLRDRVIVAADADPAAHETAALASAKVREHTDGKTIRKIIVVPRKLVNIVAN